MALLIRGCGGEDESRKPGCIVFFPDDRRPQCRGKFRGAMLRRLKHAVRKILTDRLEIVFRWGEMAVARDLQQKFEFCSMELETVDLLVTQNKTANHCSRIKKSFPFRAQARVGCERFIRAYPGADRPFGNVHVQTLADRALRITERAAEIIR